MLSNCDAGEDSWESFGQQGDQTIQSSRKSVLNIHWKEWCWSSNTFAEESAFFHCEELTHWKRPWCWERLRVGEGDDRGWDVWMGSMTGWTWVSASCRSRWWTGKPGVLQSMGSQSLTLLSDWTELNWFIRFLIISWKNRGTSKRYCQPWVACKLQVCCNTQGSHSDPPLPSSDLNRKVIWKSVVS